MIIGQYPQTRLRRVRQSSWVRALVRETHLTPADLILPLFVCDRDAPREIEAMPGMRRYAIDELRPVIDRALAAGIQAVALFPYTPDHKRTPNGEEALNPENLICQACRFIKSYAPQLGVITDVALDPYTDHGHDGLMGAGDVLNDETVEILAKQALNQARAGADILAPSDMMDGRIAAIRHHLDQHNFHQKMILSYAAKFASAYYGPFRVAVGVGGKKLDKRTYQLSPKNIKEAISEVGHDIQEGADFVIVKPGLPYLDIIKAVTETFQVPVFAYQVSGEYAMIQAAAQNGWIQGDAVMLESVLAMKRAGASAILTYAACDVAEGLS